MAQDPLATRPQSVAIVALGPSSKDFITARAHKNSALLVDEVWAVNSGAEVFACDKVWLMDDLRKMQQRYPGWAQRLRSLDKPIVTCRHYDEWPTSVEYPLNDVLHCIRDDYFTNTVAYAIAYAILTRVEDLYLFGCDFMYPGSKIVEPGAECCAYMLAIAKERGVHWRIPSNSTLLDSNLVRMDGATQQARRPLYGYDYNPGDSKRRVERGVGSELDHLVARKAPHAIEGLENAIHAASAPHGQGSIDRSDGGGQGNPVHPPVAGNQSAAVPAERSRVLGGRDERRASPGMGSAAHRTVQSETAGADRMVYASESTAAGLAFDPTAGSLGCGADDGKRNGRADLADERGTEFAFKRGNGAAGDPVFPA